MPEGGRLVFDAVAERCGQADPVPCDSSRLVVETLAAGTRRPTILALDPGKIPAGGAVEIGPSAQGPVRLTLRAEADGSGGACVGLRLLRPRIETDLPPRGEASRARASRGPVRRPNVLLYLVDSLRADRLGCYGYDRGTSPNVDAFAAQATRFACMTAQTDWTRGAVASIFTSMMPRGHRVRSGVDALPPSIPVMAEIFRELGYETAGILTNANVSQAFGFDRGFSDYEYLPESEDGEIHQLSDRANEVALAWLDALPGDAPFFLYVHTSDPHIPYAPRSPYRERFAPQVADPALLGKALLDQLGAGSVDARQDPALARDLADLYDAEVAFNDEQFGALLRALEARDLTDSTIVVFLSDHGEEFQEHGGWSHASTLYAEQVDVPLIIRFPDRRGAGLVVSQPARQIDVLPTLLDSLGEDPPPTAEGRSLLPAIGSGRTLSGAPVMAELDFTREVKMVIVDGMKLVVDPAGRHGNGAVVLFDLAADPGEKVNVFHERPVWAGFLLAQLAWHAAFVAVTAEAVPADLDPETRRTLEALGYLR
jgi:arylsulfatase A-like enzyme